jgi:8-oxo-dGTP pyrophosphatase MutT (NUDIX family)
MAEQPRPPQRWKKLGAREVAHTRIFSVESVDFHHPHRAAPQDFFVINAPDWVNVLALTPDHRLVLVRQFRFGSNDFSLEIPGGVIDGGEDCVAAGVRELREETGYVGRAARLLGSVRPNPAIQNNHCHLVLVEDARADARLDWDPDEEFEILALPVDEVYARAYRGEITHAMVLDALLLFTPVWAEIKRRAAGPSAV